MKRIFTLMLVHFTALSVFAQGQLSVDLKIKTL